VTIQLAELAVRYGCSLRGDPDAEVDRVGTLQESGAGAISFLANPGYRQYLAATNATAVILEDKFAEEAPCNCLITDNPYAVYAHIAQELHPEPQLKPGVHPSVVTGDGCKVPASCEISAGVVLGDDVELGENVYVGPNCVIGDSAIVGECSRLMANVTCYQQVRIGKRCLLHSGSVIGADGFGIAQSPTGWVKVPQRGSVVIGDDVEVGAGTTIDRGAIEDTCIGDDVKLDNQVQIAHNVIVGDHTAIAAQSGVAGSATIGARCLLGGRVAVSGHISVTDDVILMGRAGVTHSIKEAGTYSSALSVEEAGRWRRVAARIKQLDDLAKRLIRLERQSGKQD